MIASRIRCWGQALRGVCVDSALVSRRANRWFVSCESGVSGVRVKPEWWQNSIWWTFNIWSPILLYYIFHDYITLLSNESLRTLFMQFISICKCFHLFHWNLCLYVLLHSGKHWVHFEMAHCQTLSVLSHLSSPTQRIIFHLLPVFICRQINGGQDWDRSLFILVTTLSNDCFQVLWLSHYLLYNYIIR